jgi:AcrR family transcriptional regulator
MPTDDDRLLDAAARALALDPACGMGEIARAAGISRATLHRRYPTRACLEEAIIDRSMARLGAITDEIDAQGLTGRAALEALVPRAFPIAESMAFILANPAMENDPDLLARGDRFLARWTAWVEAGQRRGEIRVDVPARWVIEALHGLGHAALYATAAGLVAPRDAQRLMLSTLLDGVSEPAPGTVLDRTA